MFPFFSKVTEAVNFPKVSLLHLGEGNLLVDLASDFSAVVHRRAKVNSIRIGCNIICGVISDAYSHLGGVPLRLKKDFRGDS